jgi:hypothetical protein
MLRLYSYTAIPLEVGTTISSHDVYTEHFSCEENVLSEMKLASS